MDVQLRSPPGDVLWFPALRERQTTKTWATRGKTNNTEGKKIQTPNNHCLDLCLPNGFHSVCFLCRKIEGCTWQWNKVQAYRPLEVWGLRPDVGVKWVGGDYFFQSAHEECTQSLLRVVDFKKPFTSKLLHEKFAHKRWTSTMGCSEVGSPATWGQWE